MRQGDFASAQTILSDALKRSPGDASLYNLDGVVKAQTKDFAGSEASFRKAIALAPSYEDAYLNLGHLYQDGWTGQASVRDKAIAVYEQLLKLDPENIEANYQSAVLLMENGSFSLSLQHLSKLPAAAQEHSQALSVRCGDYVGSGQAPKADGVADRMLRNGGLAEADVTTLLPLLAEYKSTSIEIKLLEGLRERNLATANSLTSLGLLYKQQGRFADARKTLDAAAQLPPESVPLLLELAQLADEQKDYTGTLGYLAHARELEPRNASIHFFWGMTCVKMNLAEEAYQSLKKAVSLDPNNAYYNYAMGAVTSQREDASESIPYFKKYCTLRPDDPRGRLALGSAYFASHDDESAEKVLRTVANYPETAAGAHYYLGRIANHQGNFPDALLQLQMALKAHSDYADAYAELGLVYLKQKDYARARDDLWRAIEIEPDNYPANLNLLILYQRTQNPKADEQSKRFDELTEKRAQRIKDFLRTIQVTH
ncbi:MAG TPA: tetratricopeptide repeat protein [Terriglobia bacterium]|nr:tetratricopeptide repeat protein [Terriglobia bacterium]